MKKQGKKEALISQERPRFSQLYSRTRYSLIFVKLAAQYCNFVLICDMVGIRRRLQTSLPYRLDHIRQRNHPLLRGILFLHRLSYRLLVMSCCARLCHPLFGWVFHSGVVWEGIDCCWCR